MGTGLPPTSLMQSQMSNGETLSASKNRLRTCAVLELAYFFVKFIFTVCSTCCFYTHPYTFLQLAWLLKTLCSLSFAIFVWWCFDELNVCFILTVSVCCQAPATPSPSSCPAHPWACPSAAMARGLGTATQRPTLRVRWPIHPWPLVPTSTCSPAKVSPGWSSPESPIQKSM